MISTFLEITAQSPSFLPTTSSVLPHGRWPGLLFSLSLALIYSHDSCYLVCGHCCKALHKTCDSKILCLQAWLSACSWVPPSWAQCTICPFPPIDLLPGSPGLYLRPGQPLPYQNNLGVLSDPSRPHPGTPDLICGELLTSLAVPPALLHFCTPSVTFRPLSLYTWASAAAPTSSTWHQSPHLPHSPAPCLQPDWGTASW